MWGILGFAVSAFRLMIDGGNWLLKYRKKTEQRGVVLSNRDELVRAIVAFRDAALEVVKQQDNLDKMDAQSPNLVHVEAVTARDEAYGHYIQTEKKVDSEKFVAGKAFDQPISDLIAFISTQVFLKIEKPNVLSGDSHLPVFTLLELTGRIAGKAAEAIGEIDNISRL